MEESKKVLNTILTMTANLEKGDLDGVMASYEPGAAILFEPGAPVSDPDVARQIFSELAAANPSVSYGDHEVYLAGDIAVHLAPWSMEGKAQNGDPLTMGGLTVAVLRRQADGNWLMAIDNPHGAQGLTAANS